MFSHGSWALVFSLNLIFDLRSGSGIHIHILRLHSPAQASGPVPHSAFQQGLRLQILSRSC